jgi:hypothetical protein
MLQKHINNQELPFVTQDYFYILLTYLLTPDASFASGDDSVTMSQSDLIAPCMSFSPGQLYWPTICSW